MKTNTDLARDLVRAFASLNHEGKIKALAAAINGAQQAGLEGAAVVCDLRAVGRGLSATAAAEAKACAADIRTIALKMMS